MLRTFQMPLVFLNLYLGTGLFTEITSDIEFKNSNVCPLIRTLNHPRRILSKQMEENIIVFPELK